MAWKMLEGNNEDNLIIVFDGFCKASFFVLNLSQYK